MHFKAKIDAEDEVAEYDEGDNTSRVESYVYDPNAASYRSDIVVEDLYLKVGDTVVRDGGSILEDDSVNPYCVVKNQGMRDVRNGTRLAYYVNADSFRGDDGLDASDLPVGGVKTEYISDAFRLGDTGNRSYRCCADYQGNVSELDEGNNCQTFSFTVK